MKKISILLMAALSMGFVACDNDFDFPNPPGQSNPQEEMFDAATLGIAPAVSGTINLGQANNSNLAVALAQVTDLTNLPEGYDLAFTGQISASDDFSNPVEFSTVMDSTIITANPDDLDAAFHEIFNTIDPAAKSANIRFKGYATNGSATIRLGGENTYFCSMTANIEPFAPAFTIEDAYYLIGTCTGGTIDKDKAIKMSNSGASPYDDPVFSAVVDITADEASVGYEWAVVPASTLAAGSGLVISVTDTEFATEPNGLLKDYNSTGTFGVINSDNKHLITVNMRPDEDGFYTYSVELTIPNLWTPGPSNGWNQDASQLLYTDNYKFYQGYVHVDGEFKFTSAPDWNHTNYGFAEAGKLSTDPGAGNLKVNQDDVTFGNGLYWCTADITALTYTATAINTIGIIGDATEGGWDKETVMTPSADFLTWTVRTTLKEGTFKFRANDGWDINLGNTLDDLRPNGDNINAPETGEVTITLNLNTLPYIA
ncbi:MAG: hypothetical protein K2H57_07940, partial [Duncaniella sp.]|nr:hypothetical protein [Duncaniella sp.]